MVGGCLRLFDRWKGREVGVGIGVEVELLSLKVSELSHVTWTTIYMYM